MRRSVARSRRQRCSPGHWPGKSGVGRPVAVSDAPPATGQGSLAADLHTTLWGSAYRMLNSGSTTIPQRAALGSRHETSCRTFPASDVRIARDIGRRAGRGSRRVGRSGEQPQGALGQGGRRDDRREPPEVVRPAGDVRPGAIAGRSGRPWSSIAIRRAPRTRSWPPTGRRTTRSRSSTSTATACAAAARRWSRR